MRMTKNKWFLPAFSVAMGLVLFVAAWIGDDLRRGLSYLAVLTGFGLIVLFSGRSETVRGLRGDARDERFRMIDIQASAFAGLIVILVLIGAWVVEIARGHEGDPYARLLAVAGVAYLVAIAFMRWRS